MGSMNEVSSAHWVESLNGYVKPYWDDLLQGDWCEGVELGPTRADHCAHTRYRNMGLRPGRMRRI